MQTIYEQAEQYQAEVPFKDRAKEYFLGYLEYVKALLEGREKAAKRIMDEQLDMVAMSFNFGEKEALRVNEMGDSVNGMIRFVEDGIGNDPLKPVSRNEYGAWIDVENKENSDDA